MINKIIGITGSTSGIGLEMKKQLEENNTVINFSRTNGFDLSSNEGVKKTINEIKRSGLDFLFLNSGVYSSGQFDDILFEEIDKLININLVANIKMISKLKKEILSGLKIIVTLSTASFLNGADEAVYNISKKALKEYLIAVETELKYYSKIKTPFFYFVPNKINGTKMTASKNIPSKELSNIVSLMLDALESNKTEFISKKEVMETVFDDYINDPITQGISSIEYRKGLKND